MSDVSPRSEHLGRVESFLRGLQQQIIKATEGFEPQVRFQQDHWQKPPIDAASSAPQLSGAGITAVLKNGAVLEQAGVGFSDVYGTQLPASATAVRPELAGRSFRAIGVSVVIHPRNPFAPTSHMNVRYFEASKVDEPPIWWFGGGFDLTPFYPFEEDILHWHRTAQNLCDQFGKDLYQEHKAHCDRYFFLKHRQETRGVGGLFFDDLNQLGFEQSFAYQQAVGLGYLDALLPIIERRQDTPYGPREEAFQLYRRGRYVEFNLVWDRGTLFGLQSGGRTESILMSLPPRVRFEYDYQAEPGSPEAKLTHYLQARDWLGEAQSAS